MLINTMFPDHKGCKTQAGAQSRLDAAKPLLDHVEIQGTVHTAVLQRPDGTWIAVAILGSRSIGGLALQLINYKVCVCNV